MSMPDALTNSLLSWRLAMRRARNSLILKKHKLLSNRKNSASRFRCNPDRLTGGPIHARDIKVNPFCASEAGLFSLKLNRNLKYRLSDETIYL